MKIRFLDIAAQYRQLGVEIDMAVGRVLASGGYVAGGENAALERELAAYIGVPEVVGVNSGTDALLFTLKALGIGANDEVVVPTYTFFATAEAVCLAGARPRFADCASRSFNVDVDSIQRAWTQKTKAIVVVHLFGEPVDLAPIREFCDSRGLHLIEDAAQAIGARYRGRHVGGFGVAGAFSFYPTKNLGACGDGGAVSCSDAELAARLRRLRNHGRSGAYEHVEIGYNSRLDEIQAAILRVKLPYLDRWNEQRRKLAEHYRLLLRDTQCEVPGGCDREGTLSVFHHLTITHPRRNALRRFLARHEVETAIYYPIPCHLQSPFCNNSDLVSLPVAECYAAQALSLPIYPDLPDAAIDRIAELVHAFEQE